MAAANSPLSGLPIPPAINLPSHDDNQAGASVFHSTTSSSVQLIQPRSKLVTVKLEDENFLTWKQQILIAI